VIILVLRHKEWFIGDIHFYLKFWAKLTPSFKKRQFPIELIFACSALAVTPSEKSSIITNRKTTTRFPMSLRWTSYVAPSPQMGSKREM